MATHQLDMRRMKEPKRSAFDLYTLPMRRKKRKSEYDIYPGLNRRMTAVTIDSFIMLLFAPFFDWFAPIDSSGLASITYTGSFLATFVQVLQSKSFINSWLHNLFTQMGFFMLYSAICWHFWSATFGKMIMQMKVVDSKTLQPITTLQIILRNAGYIMSCFTLMLGIFWISFNKRHRAWHDYLADSAVITAPFKLFPSKEKPAPQPQETDTNETIAD